MSLAEARDKRDEARKLVKDGKDPSMVAKRNKLVRSSPSAVTFEGFARAWHELQKANWKVRLRWFTKVTLTVLPPRRFAIEGEMTARQRRAIAGRRLYDEMSAMIFATSDTQRTLFSALCEAREIHGGKALVVEDVKREPLSYDKLFAGTTVLGKRLAQGTGRKAKRSA